MKALEDQLSRYGDVIEEHQREVALHEILSDDGDLIATPTPPRRRTRAWAFAASIAVVFAVGAGVGLVQSPQAAQSPETTLIQEPSTTSLAPSTTLTNDPLERGQPPVVGFEEVGVDTSLGKLEWTLIQGGANSCPPTVRTDQGRGGYYSTWCNGGVLHSEDGLNWTEYTDFPSFEDRPDLYGIPELSELPPTLPVDATTIYFGQTIEEGTYGPEPFLYVTKTNFGWVASRYSGESQPSVPIGRREVQIWISTDGHQWEAVDPPPRIDTWRSVWGNAGGGAGDILYFGYVTNDYEDGNYLWVGHLTRQ